MIRDLRHSEKMGSRRARGDCRYYEDSDKKERVLLSDSHESNCSYIFGENLDGIYEVCGVVKPNARPNEASRTSLPNPLLQ